MLATSYGLASWATNSYRNKTSVRWWRGISTSKQNSWTCTSSFWNYVEYKKTGHQCISTATDLMDDMGQWPLSRACHPVRIITPLLCLSQVLLPVSLRLPCTQHEQENGGLLIIDRIQTYGGCALEHDDRACTIVTSFTSRISFSFLLFPTRIEKIQDYVRCA